MGQLLLLLRPLISEPSTLTPTLQGLLSLTSMAPLSPLTPPRSTPPRSPMLRLEELSTPLDTTPMDLPDLSPTPTVLLFPSSPLMLSPPELNTSQLTALKQIDNEQKKKKKNTRTKSK